MALLHRPGKTRTSSLNIGSERYITKFNIMKSLVEKDDTARPWAASFVTIAFRGTKNVYNIRARTCIRSRIHVQRFHVGARVETSLLVVRCRQKVDLLVYMFSQETNKSPVKFNTKGRKYQLLKDISHGFEF